MSDFTFSISEGGFNDLLDPIKEAVGLDLEVIDVPDTAANLLKTAIKDAIKAYLPPLPGWAEDFLDSIIDWAADQVATILDLPDDAEEWVMDIINQSIGLGDLIFEELIAYYAAQQPLLTIPGEFKASPSGTQPGQNFGGFGPDEAPDSVPPPDQAKLAPLVIPVKQPSFMFSEERLALEVDLDV